MHACTHACVHTHKHTHTCILALAHLKIDFEDGLWLCVFWSLCLCRYAPAKDVGTDIACNTGVFGDPAVGVGKV